ncbi:sel1 repeat family protein [Photobacterium sp. ZSDE20]|uniref:Sel1 repeat family protein n=1 Tax=Photobacterium pectinilyticum TaxID=2906793 RepID=A0ABT1N0Y5_9GAMM|nr:tetratricopeptide repeat protein [Photobacterium sp. ZSDE20]MCQ1058360.1 sel1 repeat family protein [Photobacterium sp. ZSDE20]MDD1827863.1 sel1 repeat family protein [Photobacterium sp. ZSDE20]
MRKAVIYISHDERLTKVGKSFRMLPREQRARTDNAYYVVEHTFEVLVEDDRELRRLENRIHEFLREYFTPVNHKATTNSSEWYDSAPKAIKPFVELKVLEHRERQAREECTDIKDKLKTADELNKQLVVRNSELNNQSNECKLETILKTTSFTSLSLNLELSYLLNKQCAEYRDSINLRIGHGDVEAMFLEGKRLINKDELSEQAVKWIGRASHTLFPAEVLLATACLEAAFFDTPYGLESLGESFEEGKVLDCNPMLAAKYYLKAAELGSSNAMAKICIFFNEGYGVEKDPAQAFLWANKAASAGHAKGLEMLSNYYSSGVGVEPDQEKAYQLLIEASQVNEFCENRISNHVFNLLCVDTHFGKGTHVDLEQSYNWAKKSSERGDSIGRLLHYYCLKEGYGVTANLEQAKIHLDAWIDAGDPFALAARYKDHRSEPDFLLRALEANPDKPLNFVHFYLSKSNFAQDVAFAIILCEDIYEFAHLKCAVELLIDIYTDGEVTEPDAEKAAYWRSVLNSSDTN